MSTAKVKRPAQSAEPMTEQDWIVRGTQDPHEALALVVEVLEEDYYGDEMLVGVARPRPGIDHYELAPEAIQAMADWCHEMLARARPGYYRKVHCLPSSGGAWEGWSWQLQYADGPGRGAFAGVYFRSL